MPRVIGRDRELKRVSAALHGAAASGIARSVRVSGPSGIGKTAFMDAAAAALDGWVAARATGMRIQQRLSNFVIGRLSASLLDGLGAEAERYVAGLPAADSPEATTQRFIRLVEGVTVDHPLLLTVDDVQWCDRESVTALEGLLTLLADRRVVLLSGERTGESPLGIEDVFVDLHPLDAAAAATLARTHYPDAPNAVIDAIVTHAGGQPLDVEALARAAAESQSQTADDVDASLRATIASRVSRVRPDLREFLRTCSLIEEPIDLALLQRLYPKSDELDTLVQEAATQFLVQDGPALRFVHAAIGQSVRETISIDIPYRRRILSALSSISAPTLELLEQTIDQARACGDRDNEYHAVQRLAEEAFEKGHPRLGAAALERAITLREPDADTIVSTYSRLAHCYGVLGREHDTMRTATSGIAAARRAGVEHGFGPLVSQQILTMVHDGDYDGARAAVERYARELSSPQDLAQVFSSAMLIAAFDMDVSLMNAMYERFEPLAAATTPAVRLRATITQAILALREGDAALTETLVQEGRRYTRDFPMGNVMLSTFKTFAELHVGGYPAARRHISGGAMPHADDNTSFVSDDLIILFDLLDAALRGDHADVIERTNEALLGDWGPYMQRSFLSITALSAIINAAPLPPVLATRIESEALQLTRGEQSAALVPLAAGAAVLLADRSRDRARSILQAVLRKLERPLDMSIIVFTPLAALAARKLDDHASMLRLANGSVHRDRTPLATAMNELAAHIAKGSAVPAPLVQQLDTLGFSRLVPAVRPAEKAAPRGVGPTRREREIATLVSQGLTNREIAEKLVLSERTVESHIANAFAKLNITSRTQLATWALSQ